MKYYFFFLLIIFIGCTEEYLDVQERSINIEENKGTGNTFNMLWNEYGVKKRSFMHLSLDNGHVDTINRAPIKYFCDLSEADNVGNPHNTWPFSYLTNEGRIQSPLKTAPSFYLVSEGYENYKAKQYPGFDFWVESEESGVIEFKMMNNAKLFTGEEKLHEVGIVFQHWFNEWDVGFYSFKKQYNVHELRYIMPNFDFRIDYFNDYNSPNRFGLRTNYLTSDLRLEYWKNGIKLRTDVLGVLFSNSNDNDLNGNSSDAIFFKNLSSNINYVLLHGYKLGLGIQNSTNVSNTYTNISFDYKPLIISYLPPPPAGCTYSDATIVGLDIYSSTRYADVSFYLKNIYLYGMYN